MTITTNEIWGEKPSCVSEKAWKPRLMDRIAAEFVGEEALLLDRVRQKIHHLDAVGTRILALCDGKHDLTEISAELRAQFDAPADKLTEDAAKFLRQLLAAGIVE